MHLSFCIAAVRRLFQLLATPCTHGWPMGFYLIWLFHQFQSRPFMSWLPATASSRLLSLALSPGFFVYISRGGPMAILAVLIQPSFQSYYLLL